MRAAVLAIFLVTAAPAAWADPPKPGDMHVEFRGSVLLCDTLQQLKDIALAPPDSQEEVYEGYNSLTDSRGEGTCAIQAVTAYNVEEVVSLGDGHFAAFGNRTMSLWAIHFHGSGFGQEGWALWPEAPKGQGT